MPPPSVGVKYPSPEYFGVRGGRASSDTLTFPPSSHASRLALPSPPQASPPAVTVPTRNLAPPFPPTPQPKPFLHGEWPTVGPPVSPPSLGFPKPANTPSPLPPAQALSPFPPGFSTFSPPVSLNLRVVPPPPHCCCPILSLFPSALFVFVVVVAVSSTLGDSNQQHTSSLFILGRPQPYLMASSPSPVLTLHYSKDFWIFFILLSPSPPAFLFLPCFFGSEEKKKSVSSGLIDFP